VKAWPICGVIALIAHGAAGAGEVDDCVLNGLKGVSSDAAARMVKQACESKVASARADRLNGKYGEKVNFSLSVESWNRWASNGLRATLRNTSSLTATLVEVSFSKPDSQDNCTAPPTKKELYRVKIRPGSNGNFMVRDVTSVMDKTGGICIDAIMVRGRQPSSFDVSIGSFEPYSANEIDAINDELGERYATIKPDFRLLLDALITHQKK
jgi:hypothetical protein